MAIKWVLNSLVSWVSVVTGTETSGTATANGVIGQVTSEALTTAAWAEDSITISNNRVKATSVILANVEYGTATQGSPIGWVKSVSDGSFVVELTNVAASDALDGTVIWKFLVINPK